MGTVRVFIVNRAARTCPPGIEGSILKIFPEAEIFFTRGPGDGSELARRALGLINSPDDVIAACGGDGTLREVAQAVGSRARIGIIPVGTVNQVAARLGLPKGLEKQIGILAEPGIAEIYPGVCRFDGEEREHNFFIGISAGPDADAVSSIRGGVKRHLGIIAYGEAFMRRMVKRVSPDILCVLEEGGKVEKFKASQAIALADGIYGGLFRFFEDLRPQTPSLRFAATAGGRFGVAVFFLCAMIPGCRSGLRRKIGEGSLTLELDSPGVFQIDGDEVKARTARVETARTPLKICVAPGGG